MPRFRASAVLVTWLALGAALPLAALAQAPLRTMTVTGSGEVRTAPDTATLRLGVLAEARTAQAASERLRAELGPLLEALEAAGVAPADVQTTALDLRPVRDPNAGQPARTPRIIGFEAETQLTVTGTDPAALGGLIDAVLEAGANRLDGIEFGLRDPGTAQDAARADAVRDALARARVYAQAAGLTLGEVLRLTDLPGEPGFDPGLRMMADSAMPVAPGALRVTAQVTVTFALAD